MTSSCLRFGVVCLVAVGASAVCLWGSITYNVGDQIPVPPQWPCYENCTCQSDGVWCYYVSCPPLLCSEEHQEAGECCPFCVDGAPTMCLDRSGDMYDVGQAVPPPNVLNCQSLPCPCYGCECTQSGNVSCSTAGKCCLLNDGSYYLPGEQVPPPPCYKNCTCESDSVVWCFKESCQPPPCPEEYREKPAGQCCETCVDGAPVPEVQCHDMSGEAYNVGQAVPSQNVLNCQSSPCQCYGCECTQSGNVSCSTAGKCCFLNDGSYYLAGQAVPSQNVLDCQSLHVPCQCYGCECTQSGNVSCSTAGKCCLLNDGSYYLAGATVPSNTLCTNCTCAQDDTTDQLVVTCITNPGC